MISGLWVNGLAPVGNIRIRCTRIGAEKRMAAKLDGPVGSRVHQCNNIGPIRGLTLVHDRDLAQTMNGKCWRTGDNALQLMQKSRNKKLLN